MKTWKLQLEVSVADSWIADGFDLTQGLDEIEEALKKLLPFSYDNEVEIKTKIIKAPTKKELEALMDGTIEPGD